MIHQAFLSRLKKGTKANPPEKIKSGIKPDFFIGRALYIKKPAHSRSWPVPCGVTDLHHILTNKSVINI